MKSWQIRVDTGGTFTDCLAIDPQGRLHRAKVLSSSTLRGRITDRQIEAARIAMTRYVKRGGKIWLRIFPDKPVSKKPAETRMGKGKGGPEYWVAVVRQGRMLYEMEEVPEDIAKEAFRLAQHKLPIATRFVTKK